MYHTKKRLTALPKDFERRKEEKRNETPQIRQIPPSLHQNSFFVVFFFYARHRQWFFIRCEQVETKTRGEKKVICQSKDTRNEKGVKEMIIELKQPPTCQLYSPINWFGEVPSDNEIN